MSLHVVFFNVMQVLTTQQSAQPQAVISTNKAQQQQQHQQQQVAMVTQFVAMPQSPAIVAMAQPQQVECICESFP